MFPSKKASFVFPPSKPALGGIFYSRNATLLEAFPENCERSAREKAFTGSARENFSSKSWSKTFDGSSCRTGDGSDWQSICHWKSKFVWKKAFSGNPRKNVAVAPRESKSSRDSSFWGDKRENSLSQPRESVVSGDSAEDFSSKSGKSTFSRDARKDVWR